MGVAVAAAASVASGASFAAGSVLQQQEARAVEAEGTVALLRQLTRRPRWWFGVAVAASAYGWQALALAFGPLALVQPLVVTELPFALLLAAVLHRRRLGARDLAAAGLVAGGVGLFVVVSSPGQGVSSLGLVTWGFVLGGMAAVVAVLAAVARRLGGLAQTSTLAAAGAVCFGTMAPLMKETTALMVRDHVGVVAEWQPWAMVAAALGGFAFAQRAFASGPLAVSLPLLESVQPIVGVVIGVSAFGEPLVSSPGALAVEAIGAIAAVGGIVLLDTSPSVAAALHGADRDASPAAARRAAVPGSRRSRTPSAR